MTTPSPEHLRAEAIVDAGVTLLALIDEDNLARQGVGGPLRSTAALHSLLTHGLSEFAAAFGLPWGGPTQPDQAQPTGGE